MDELQRTNNCTFKNTFVQNMRDTVFLNSSVKYFIYISDTFKTVIKLKNQCRILRKLFVKILIERSLTSGDAVLRSKLVDGRCKVQSPIALVDLAVRSFPWFSPKLAKIRPRIPLKDTHGGHSPYRPRSHKRTIGLKPTTQP